jgi:hypothetical protein
VNYAELLEVGYDFAYIMPTTDVSVFTKTSSCLAKDVLNAGSFAKKN